jgi:cyanate permease
VIGLSETATLGLLTMLPLLVVAGVVIWAWKLSRRGG